MTTATSKEAYQEIRPNLANRQYFILCLLAQVERATNKELSKRFGVPINEITPRILELRNMGVVIQVDERPDYITRKTAAVWTALNPFEAKRNLIHYIENRKSPVPKIERQLSFL